MSTIRISLPDALSTYLNEQATRRGYASPSEFVQNLIETDQHRQLKDEIESMLMESIDGPFTDWRDEDVADIRRSGRRIIARRQGR